MSQVLTGGEPTDQIVVRLEETRPQILGIQAIDICVSSVRVRFGSVAAHGVDQVFQPDVGQIVRSICDGVAHSVGCVDRPDFFLRSRGLTIEGYSISVTIGRDNLRRFKLRFHRATGNALAIFKLSPGQDTGLALFTPRILSGPEDQLTSERLFNEMLSQLYLPLVNLNTYLGHVLDGSVNDRGTSLSNSVVQLKTRAETLQFAFDRLISSMMVEKYSARDVSEMAASTAA